MTDLHLWLDADGQIAGSCKATRIPLPDDRHRIGQALAKRYHAALLTREKDQLLEQIALDAQAHNFRIIFHEEAQL